MKACHFDALLPSVKACHFDTLFPFMKACTKLQALVYDILPSTTAVFSYIIGSRNLSANKHFVVVVGAQIVVSLLQTTQIISDICFITDHIAYTSSKPKLFELRWNFFLTWGGCISCLRACLGTRLLPQSYQLPLGYPNLSEGADHIGGQLHGDKECPLSGVSNSGRVRMKVPESDAPSVGLHFTTLLPTRKACHFNTVLLFIKKLLFFPFGVG